MFETPTNLRATKSLFVCCSGMQKLVFVLLALLFYGQIIAQTGKVVLEVENIQIKKGGEIAVAVFDKTNFLKKGKELSGVFREVSSSKMTFVFDGLSSGEYAFVAYQDIDRNKSMKTNMIGYPKEPWGISNNPRIFFGPPSFEESKIKVEANKTTTVSLRLN